MEERKGLETIDEIDENWAGDSQWDAMEKREDGFNTQFTNQTMDMTTDLLDQATPTNLLTLN